MVVGASGHEANSGADPRLTETVVATRYWVGGRGDWTDAAHWADASGGRGGAGAPAANDVAVFDGRSGQGTVLIDGDVQVLDLLMTETSPPDLVLSMKKGTLRCSRDAVFLGGAIDNRSRAFSLSVGRDLDTSRVRLAEGLRLALTGTGCWRYSLEKLHKPSLHTLVAAQRGQTTTLRPVGIAPIGVDIDTQNLVLGDATSLLTMDVSEVKQKGPASVIIEIHQNTENHVDVDANGCRLAITSIEHETGRVRNVRLQHKLDFSGMKRIYDITGSYRDWEKFKDDPSKAFGGGPTWTIMGPMDLGHLRLSIEKTCVLDTGGHDLKAGQISMGASGCGELHMHNSHVTVAGHVSLGSSKFPGLIDLGTGRLTCRTLTVQSGSRLFGKKGAVIDVTERFVVHPNALMQLDEVTLAGRQPSVP